jgi:hypothetical protein
MSHFGHRVILVVLVVLALGGAVVPVGGEAAGVVSATPPGVCGGLGNRC